MSRTPLRINRSRIAALVGLRRDAGLTQRRLAKRAKHPQSWIAKIETGARYIYLSDLDDLASAYGMPTHKFVKRFYERPEIKSVRRLERVLGRRRKATCDPSWQIFITAINR